MQHVILLRHRKQELMPLGIMLFPRLGFHLGGFAVVEFGSCLCVFHTQRNASTAIMVCALRLTPDRGALQAHATAAPGTDKTACPHAAWPIEPASTSPRLWSCIHRTRPRRKAPKIRAASHDARCPQLTWIKRRRFISKNIATGRRRTGRNAQ